MAKLPCFITAESADSPRCIVSEKFDFSPRIHTRTGMTVSANCGLPIDSYPHARTGITTAKTTKTVLLSIPPRAHGNNLTDEVLKWGAILAPHGNRGSH